MDSQSIEVFLQIARHRSVSRAAEAAHLAQSTVSKRLRMLEESLGYTLVERGKGLKKVELTPQGEEFLRLAERWQDLVREALEVSRMEPRHSLVIGTVSSANMTFVPQLCRRLWTHEPHVSYRIVTLHSMEMYEEIEKRTIDVGFSLLEQQSPNVAVAPCLSVPLIGVRTRREQRPRRMDVRALDPQQCVFVPWGTRYQTWHDYWFHSGKSHRASIDNPLILFSVLEHPEQWAIVPKGIAHAMLATGRFETFQVDPPPPERVFYRLTHKSPRTGALYPLEVFTGLLGRMLREDFPDVYSVF